MLRASIHCPAELRPARGVGHGGGRMKRRVWRGVVVLVSLVMVSSTGRRTGALRIDRGHRHRFVGSRGARRHRHDYACRDQSGARDDEQRNRELCVSERRRRHVPRRRDAARLPVVPRPGHRRAAEHRRSRRREAQRRRAVGVGAGVGRRRAAADGDRGRADADDEPATGEPARSTAGASRAR